MCQLQDLYDEVDKVKDPNPDKERTMVPRVRGPAKLDAVHQQCAQVSDMSLSGNSV